MKSAWNWKDKKSNRIPSIIEQIDFAKEQNKARSSNYALEYRANLPEAGVFTCWKRALKRF